MNVLRFDKLTRIFSPKGLPLKTKVTKPKVKKQIVKKQYSKKSAYYQKIE